VQDALEMRVAHPDFVHVVERVLDVVDAGAADADALRDEARAAVQVELAHIGGMRRVGKKRQRPDRPPAAQAHRDEARLIHAPRHFAVPQPPERAEYVGGIDAKRHAPARAAAAQADHQARPAVRAAVARRQDAQRAVIAVGPGQALLLVVEPGRPHERAVAEHPQVAWRQLRQEILELHVRGFNA